MKKGIFIGRATVDILFYQKGFTQENQKMSTEEYETSIGGNACNAAVTYSILGGNAVLLTTIGNSILGRSIKEELTVKYGVEVIDLLEDQYVLPCLSAIWINLENESRTIWGGRKVSFQITQLAMEQIIEKADFLLADDQFSDILIPLFEKAKERKIATVFDAESWGEKTKALFQVSSDVIASADCRPSDGKNIFLHMNQCGVLRMAITDGKNPVFWESEGCTGSIIPKQVDVVDTLGAGDILHGAYCYFKFLKGLPFEVALKKACEVSSMSVTCRGSRQGILNYVSSRRE